MSSFEKVKFEWETYDGHEFADRDSERLFFFTRGKEEADQLRAEVEALKQERWSVVATRNEALNKVAELHAALDHFKILDYNHDTARRVVATRCAEIADKQSRRMEPDKYYKTWATGLSDGAAIVSKLIRKEFNL